MIELKCSLRQIDRENLSSIIRLNNLYHDVGAHFVYHVNLFWSFGFNITWI